MDFNDTQVRPIPKKSLPSIITTLLPGPNLGDHVWWLDSPANDIASAPLLTPFSPSTPFTPLPHDDPHTIELGANGERILVLQETHVDIDDADISDWHLNNSTDALGWAQTPAAGPTSSQPEPNERIVFCESPKPPSRSRPPPSGSRWTFNETTGNYNSPATPDATTRGINTPPRRTSVRRGAAHTAAIAAEPSPSSVLLEILRAAKVPETLAAAGAPTTPNVATGSNASAPNTSALPITPTNAAERNNKRFTKAHAGASVTKAKHKVTKHSERHVTPGRTVSTPSSNGRVGVGRSGLVGASGFSLSGRRRQGPPAPVPAMARNAMLFPAQTPSATRTYPGYPLLPAASERDRAAKAVVESQFRMTDGCNIPNHYFFWYLSQSNNGSVVSADGRQTECAPYWPMYVSAIIRSREQGHDPMLHVSCVLCHDHIDMRYVNSPTWLIQQEVIAPVKKNEDAPLVLHCGHIVGSACMAKWRRSYATTNPDKPISCPVCRVPLRHEGCGHDVTGVVVAPVDNQLSNTFNMIAAKFWCNVPRTVGNEGGYLPQKCNHCAKEDYMSAGEPGPRQGVTRAEQIPDADEFDQVARDFNWRVIESSNPCWGQVDAIQRDAASLGALQ